MPGDRRRQSGGVKGRDDHAEASRPSNPTVGSALTGDVLAQLAAIETASLEALKGRYPADWEKTGQALVAAAEARRAEGAAAFLTQARAAAAPWRARVRGSGANAKVVKTALPFLVRARMAELAVQSIVQGAVSAQSKGPERSSGSLRFGWWSGTLVQRLLFARALERKPVSPGWFRLLWPLVTQRHALMPLVEPKGIYCFYSRPLVQGLADLIGQRTALEIAAGDGTLARFITEAGAPVTATDDHSWAHAVTFPDSVERLDAKAALARHQPRVVLCSWPPQANTFEREVFRTPCVERYIVITTKHRFAAGAWADYDAQTTFERREDERLSRLVLPPEVDPVVLVFDRRSSTA